MSAQPDISSILAALAAQQAPPSASQTPQQQQPAPPAHGYSGAVPHTGTPSGAPGYGLPQPTNSGSLDLSSIKPVNTGSVSINEAIAKARGIAAQKGLHEGGRSSAGPRDDARRSYRRSRSRSRSPPRRDSYRDNYNPYRDERRDDRRGAYGRDRSRSPGPRARGVYSPPPSRAQARERSPAGRAEDDSETIVIERHLVGLVIGRNGENLRRVEQDTGCRIQFLTGPESTGPHRHCRISGNPRARMEAKREINRIIDENGGNPVQDAHGSRSGSAAGRAKPAAPPAAALREGENTIQIMVPDRTVGLIIGRGGETIRDLQERSGCHVNIVGENKSLNGLRPVNLIGTAQAAAKAKELILEVVESDTKPMAQAGREPRGGQDSFPPEGMGGGHGKITDTIHVPSESVGMIIGKGGETIRDMQNATGCKINVSQASGDDFEREIELVGTRAAIEKAKSAIWEKVDAVKDKSGFGGGGGGGGGGRRGGARDDPYGVNYSPVQPAYSYSQQGGHGAAPGTGAVDPAATAADPYAAWGGYQNYAAMWYAAFAQQNNQGGSAPPNQDEQPKPPGA